MINNKNIFSIAKKWGQMDVVNNKLVSHLIPRYTVTEAYEVLSLKDSKLCGYDFELTITIPVYTYVNHEEGIKRAYKKGGEKEAVKYLLENCQQQHKERLEQIYKNLKK